MEIKLCERKEEHIRIFYKKTEDEEIQRMFPRTVTSLEEAISNFQATLHKEATSYGKTIYVQGKYIGDIWCYGIHLEEEPDAMLSYCIFEKEYWKKGIATEAVRLFLEEIIENYQLKSIGAFTYSSNLGSMRVLEKNGFRLEETFIEKGIESKYFMLSTSSI